MNNNKIITLSLFFSCSSLFLLLDIGSITWYIMDIEWGSTIKWR